MISEKDFVLATDLDGTFLGGTEAERHDFYGWLTDHRDRIGLIFVTGRDPEYISELTGGLGVPRPDYVVGDVGTTVAEMTLDHVVSPIEELELEIAKTWGNSGPRVQMALSGITGLRLQSASFRYRVSYDMDPAEFDREAIDIVNAMGLDALISDNRFFDVLPKGISKGPTLRRLLDYLGIATSKTLVAGDTLNDLSMLAMGIPAVAVGNSEPDLIENVKHLGHVHLAKGTGVAGIAEAIRHRKMFSET